MQKCNISRRDLRGMIKRDFNHPSIFTWTIFNETWGLRTNKVENGKRVGNYLGETQQWVASMYYLAKSLDPTRLAEDNSICCGAGLHKPISILSMNTSQDGNGTILKKNHGKSLEGSTFHYEQGFKQGKQPTINSECGNVWGYEGSTGDVDWS